MKYVAFLIGKISDNLIVLVKNQRDTQSVWIAIKSRDLSLHKHGFATAVEAKKSKIGVKPFNCMIVFPRRYKQMSSHTKPGTNDIAQVQCHSKSVN